MSTPEQRRRLRDYYAALHHWHDEWVAAGYPHASRFTSPPQIPSDLAALQCGAKTRQGHPCKRTDIYLSGRCKFHGGLSTGPKTPEGRAQCALNGRNPKRKKQTP